MAVVDSALEDPSLYPLEPGFQNTDTSKAAAASVAPKAEVLRRKTLLAVRKAPVHAPGTLASDRSPAVKTTPQVSRDGRPVGVTSYEASVQISEPHHNVHPRFSELRTAGLIRDSGVRRPNPYSGRMAMAWVPGADPARPLLNTNAPPTKPKLREAYVRGYAAAYYAAEVGGVELLQLEPLRRRLAELEPGNPEWQPPED